MRRDSQPKARRMTKAISIEKLPVTFKTVLRRHKSQKSGRIYYQVRAELETKKGSERREFWYGDHKSFLHETNQKTGRATVHVGCSASQRAQISKLVKGFESKRA
jgi:hypothetical protein